MQVALFFFKDNGYNSAPYLLASKVQNNYHKRIANVQMNARIRMPVPAPCFSRLHPGAPTRGRATRTSRAIYPNYNTQRPLVPHTLSMRMQAGTLCICSAAPQQLQ
jgi:hypothetical protein